MDVEANTGILKHTACPKTRRGRAQNGRAFRTDSNDGVCSDVAWWYMPDDSAAIC